MDLRNLTREQKLLGAAAALVLFAISLFFDWFGVGEFSASGWDTLPSAWLLLIIALAGAAICAAEAFSYALPTLATVALAALLSFLLLFVTVLFLLDPGGAAGVDIGRKFGLFLGLIFSLVATALAAAAWREG